MNCCNGHNAPTQSRRDTKYYKQTSLPLPPTKPKKHYLYLTLYCLAALAWVFISMSLMVDTNGSNNRRRPNDDQWSFLQPTTRNSHSNNINGGSNDDDLKLLLPPSVGLKFDWNANSNNKNNHQHLDDRQANDTGDDDDDDDDNNLLVERFRQTTAMRKGANNDTNSTATSVTLLASSSSSSSSSNATLSNSTTLVVLSVCIPGERFSDEYVHASLYNKQTFCNKWGVECILSNQRLAPNDPPPPSIFTASTYNIKNSKNPTTTTTKKKSTLPLKPYSPKWEKLYLLNRTLHTHPNADWLMWLDCDAAFTNLDIHWQTHLHPYLLDNTKVLVASKDKAGINLGVFFIPNTPPAKQLIKLLWEERHHVERYKFFLKDQVALQRVLKARPQIQRYIYTDVPQRTINSVSL